ncbi:helix-turn-helix domain-containing protein [Salinimicrobium sp. TH3]|uniref:helix-turn-helix domain-containing protein n=1 Tax=Salinimicrobium sp. TH3 TaxID=2997342 RepID=UPI0022759810|nr:helix-turn-helix domain-containing protein [Salinimicrobium sp. TH3]MCY2686770.1 helix-turn-helix domain-containing protein [Salinimicrobium sp. TH3]
MSTIQFLQTTPEQLADLISEGVKNQLQELKKDLQRQEANDELLTREQACQFLQINSSTLWAWTNKGKVIAYGISNRRYYKRSELLECLTILKK